MYSAVLSDANVATIIEQTGLSQTVASTATLKLASLHLLDSFYTPLEERFERITRIGRKALGARIAAITVVQDNRQWFKSVVGWQLTELPNAESLCSQVIETGRQIIVEDTQDDLILMSNRFVCHEPKIRFYAGCPISDSEGRTIGTFCVMDTRPRKTNAEFGALLADLGEMAQRELFTLELSNAQSSLIAKLGKARREAMFDSLTRLWNRRGGEKLLKAALKEALQRDHSLGICLADIDNFKQVNDEFGHRVGDQVLRKVASIIVASVRPQDLVCRYGGDEFLVIVRDVSEKGCFDIASRICEKTRNLPIRTRNGTIQTSISVGIAMRNRGDPISSVRLIERADQRLYKSKSLGKGGATKGKI